jgi:hypothetical protein
MHNEVSSRVGLCHGCIQNEDAPSALINNAMPKEKAAVLDSAAVIVGDALQLDAYNLDTLFQTLHENHEIKVQPSVHPNVCPMATTAVAVALPSEERASAVLSTSLGHHTPLSGRSRLILLVLVG